MQIALVSRDEIYPLGGGGIGQFVTAAARLLSRIAEVTIVTHAGLRSEYERLRAAGDERLPGPEVQVVFVDGPSAQESAGWYQPMQAYSARVLAALRAHYGDRGPDVIEFADFLGEGFVTVQAACTLDRFLRDTRVCVRLHTSAEMVEILNGYWKPDLASRAVHELERFVLARADRVIWQGGDVLGTYQRFYGQDAIAPAMRIRYPYAGPVAAPEPDFSVADRPLRLLYAGRLERRKGVINLVRAVTALGRDDFRLTVVGSDTDTGPLATSVRDQLELAVAGDERVRIGDSVSREDLARLIVEHDAIVVPSLWECWPYAALEPLHLNRPVLGTPVGGLVEMVQTGRSGWLASGTDAPALADALERLLDGRAQAQALVRDGGPLAVARGLADDAEILAGYERLARSRLTRAVPQLNVPRGRADPPLVSVVIAPAAASGPVSPATVSAVIAQSDARLELIVVGEAAVAQAVDGQVGGALSVVHVSPPGGGMGGARNAGVRHSRGRYVLTLGADVVLAPQFVARCVEILESNRELAYVTAWSRPISVTAAARPEPGDQPLGNQAALIADADVGGGATAIFRRDLFGPEISWAEDLSGAQDWQLYRRLHAAGRHGVVIPEWLLSRSPAPVSWPLADRERLEAEIIARLQESAVRWTYR